jgi:hypothetical protein
MAYLPPTLRGNNAIPLLRAAEPLKGANRNDMKSCVSIRRFIIGETLAYAVGAWLYRVNMEEERGMRENADGVARVSSPATSTAQREAAIERGFQTSDAGVRVSGLEALRSVFFGFSQTVFSRCWHVAPPVQA